MDVINMDKDQYFRGLYKLRDDDDDDEEQDVLDKSIMADTTKSVLHDTTATEMIQAQNHDLDDTTTAIITTSTSDPTPTTLSTISKPSSPRKRKRHITTQPPTATSPHSSDSDNDTDEAPSKPAKLVKSSSEPTNHHVPTFQCMKPFTTPDAALENPNAATISILSEMLSVRENSTNPQDRWKVLSYRKALSALKQQTVAITTYEQAKALPGIGDSLARKIVEVAETGRLQHLDAARDMEGPIRLFTGIYGVGKTLAQKWIQAGHNTLLDLLDNVTLTTNQRIGIQRYDDFQLKIPRAECTALGEIVTQAMKAIDEEVQVIMGGSYRRGAAECGDIDFLITKPGTRGTRDLYPILRDLVKNLTTSRFLVAALAIPHDETGRKWHGCCVLPTANPIWRRIDFLLVPATEIGAALIYFTGDDIFNRSMRLLAGKKGYSLNEKGLSRDVLRGPNRVKVSGGSIVEGADERRIFEILGVEWKEPHERVC